MALREESVMELKGVRHGFEKNPSLRIRHGLLLLWQYLIRPSGSPLRALIDSS